MVVTTKKRSMRCKGRGRGRGQCKSGKKTLRNRRSKVKSPKRYSLFGGFIRNGSVQQFVKGLLN